MEGKTQRRNMRQRLRSYLVISVGMRATFLLVCRFVCVGGMPLGRALIVWRNALWLCHDLDLDLDLRIAYVLPALVPIDWRRLT